MALSEVEELEAELRGLADDLTSPTPGECLLCYLYRMLEFGCKRHDFTRRYQRMMAPRATALLRRLSRMGGCCCECEVFLNAYQPHPRYFGVDEDGEFVMEPMPECHGVRRGSSQPCCLWQRRPRYT
ncbi:DUF2695 domain-containing protein [Arthrobacter sp. CAU 1506]|uniref:DUF2695 domain-containing protein n=1 Tax=Arthrobacter sp. CAU 1506 TaxID=2560052 RepID=UPI0010ABFA2A|nr:DUF2695 domain-containing protein [Arthrobacter sp. CAU 1506]TJY68987.1 DUF2695 domain-containing protein [Arthrobacter sp. CAU 1506]